MKKGKRVSRQIKFEDLISLDYFGKYKDFQDRDSLGYGSSALDYHIKLNKTIVDKKLNSSFIDLEEV